MNGFVGMLAMLFSAIVISCAFNSLLVTLHLTAQMSPVLTGVNIGEPKETGAGDSAIREDMAIPEFGFVDYKFREPNGFAVSVRDSKQATRSEFPQNW